MSCDFGPIPMPTSPLQTYWEEQYFSRNSTANQSRSPPVVATKTEKDTNIAPRLYEALEKLAEEQQRSEEEDKIESTYEPQMKVRKASTTHRRGPSFGQRLWSTISGGEQVPVQKMKQS